PLSARFPAYGRGGSHLARLGVGVRAGVSAAGHDGQPVEIELPALGVFVALFFGKVAVHEPYDRPIPVGCESDLHGARTWWHRAAALLSALRSEERRVGKG